MSLLDLSRFQEGGRDRDRGGGRSEGVSGLIDGSGRGFSATVW